LALIKNKDKFSSEILQKAYEAYAQEMINIHLGQGTDIFWHNGKAVDIEEDEYLQMCAFKTGCLSRMSAKLAVILSGGNNQIIEAAGRVAETMGVAFQIQDDILDIISEGEERDKFGKIFGNDIKEGKRTLMVIYALKKADKKDRVRLIEILDKHTDDIKEKEEAINIIKKYGSVEYAQVKAKEIMGDAWQEAEKLLPESPAKKRLEEFVNFLITRKI
jgi:geranylgeranyl pyrophosphate synthase